MNSLYEKLNIPSFSLKFLSSYKFDKNLKLEKKKFMRVYDL